MPYLWNNVLGLAGLELNFFRAAHMVPCFGFTAKSALIRTSGLAVAEQCLRRAKAF